MDFNPQASDILHLDLNSCFATIEQQANPLLRGKPIAVAAYTTPSGCILAPSVEAKRLGIKTGMRVRDGKQLCPDLIVLPPDPWKYRNVHQKLRRLLANYAEKVEPKSIDEFCFKPVRQDLWSVAREIKQRIRREIGEWLTVSIGIAPNRFLAKLASSLHKPDGLDEINKDNYLKVYASLKLTDLCGIKARNAARLNSVGINTVLDFYRAPCWKLKVAFASICGYYWYLRLRGWEIDDVVFARKSYGNSVALGKNLANPEQLSPILSRLTEKLGTRFRRAGFLARGVHLAISYKDGSFWHKGRLTEKELFDPRDIFKEAVKLLFEAKPQKPVREIAVSCFGLSPAKNFQLNLFTDVSKKEKLTRAVDMINSRWGDLTIGLAQTFKTQNVVLDRIAFGSVKELEEFSFQ